MGYDQPADITCATASVRAEKLVSLDALDAGRSRAILRVVRATAHA